MGPFSLPHLIAVGVLTVASAASIWLPRRYPGRWPGLCARVLALAILAGWAGEYVADGVEGVWSARDTLPLQLTDAASVAAILALWTRRIILVELTYFWGFGASLQAILTPDVVRNFPSIFYFTFFTYHIGVVVGACLLVFGCRIRPRARAAWRVFALTLCFAGIAAVGDLVTGGNYMYLRAKPVHDSLLSVMGPWPWYIASAAAFGLAVLLALQLLADTIGRANAAH